MPLGAAEQNRIVEEQVRSLEAMPAEAVSGQAAVQKAADQASLAGAEAPAEQSAQAAGRVRQVGARAFVLSGSQWIDTAFDPEQMETIKVAFLSEDYFALAERYPELAAAFALGQLVIAFADGKAYEIVPQDRPVAPLDIPLAQPKATGAAQSTQLPASATSAPTQPVEPITPIQPEQRNPLLCGGGLLPILLIPVGLVGMQIWKKRQQP
jgi:hypothetical protein